ncbi:prophage Lp1 protein 52, endolysin [Lacticaseibacillus rhamnosus MTCC 5462]|nr:prophage Lp1 protein 52, endolysin [Lacticaseibacillus rhamnosus MTCC 5462]
MYRVMYRVGWDSPYKLLSSDFGSPRLLQGKITKAVGSYDIFSCTIDPTQEAFSAITPLTTFITVVRTKPPQRILFEGRVVTVQPAMGSDGTINNVVTAEGLESFLHDSVQPWAEFRNTSPRDFLQAMINQHNSQVESYKQIKLGTITVTNSTDNVYRFSDDTKDTYTNIKEKLIDRLDGEIRLRHESTGLFLDYMPVIGEKSKQPIQLRKNLLSMSQKLDPTDVITVLKPLGAAEERTTDEGETQAVSTPRLTISDVNGGSPFLRDQKLIDQFGIQVGVQTWDDVKTDTALLTKGKEFLANQKPVKQLVQITAVDLSLVGRSVSDFWCGNYYDIINPFIGFAQTLRMSAQVIDLVDPKSSTLQAGDVVLSQEQYNLNLRQQLRQAQLFSQSYESRLRSQSALIANLKDNR